MSKKRRDSIERFCKSVDALKKDRGLLYVDSFAPKSMRLNILNNGVVELKTASFSFKPFDNPDDFFLKKKTMRDVFQGNEKFSQAIEDLKKIGLESLISRVDRLMSLWVRNSESLIFNDEYSSNVYHLHDNGFQIAYKTGAPFLDWIDINHEVLVREMKKLYLAYSLESTMSISIYSKLEDLIRRINPSYGVF